MATRHPATLEARLSTIGVGTGELTPQGEVGRTYAPFVGRDSEAFETLRDALTRETRLRVRPPDPWRCETDTATEKLWLIPGLGYHVRLETDSVCADWTLSVDDCVELEGASRLEAFKAAAERMGDISGNLRA